MQSRNCVRTLSFVWIGRYLIHLEDLFPYISCCNPSWLLFTASLNRTHSVYGNSLDRTHSVYENISCCNPSWLLLFTLAVAIPVGFYLRPILAFIAAGKRRREEAASESVQITIQ